MEREEEEEKNQVENKKKKKKKKDRLMRGKTETLVGWGISYKKDSFGGQVYEADDPVSVRSVIVLS